MGGRDFQQMAKVTKVKGNKSSAGRGHSGVILAVAILVGAVLIFGIALGVIAAVRRATALVYYNGIALDEGVTNYLASTYKSKYLAYLGSRTDLEELGVFPADSEDFWSEEVPDGSGKLWADLLYENTVSYIKSLAVKAYLFDRASGLTSEDRENINSLTEQVLSYRAGGSRDEFNKKSADMGFDYSDFCTAQELIYKANRAGTATYGESGEVLSSDAYLSICNEYYNSAYSHVKILFIRTEDEFVVDEDGNRIEGDGGDELRELTEKERAERQADIASIRAAIESLKNNGDEQMSPEYFDTFLSKYGYITEYFTTGMYFSEKSSFTEEFGDESGGLAPIVYTALTMEVGEYSEVEWESGICFVYRYENSEFGFLSSSVEAFFTDFYADAAEYVFTKSVSELVQDVELGEGFDEIDLVALKYNWELVGEA